MPHIKDGFKGERVSILPASMVDTLKQDILGKELYITDIGFYPHAYGHYCTRKKEEVNEFVLIYCVEGKGWFELDGKKQTVRADQFFILPERRAHTYSSDARTPWTIYWMHFNGEKAAFFSKGFDRPMDISPNDNSRIKERLNLFEEIFSCLNRVYSKNHLLYATTSLFHFLGSMKFMGEYRDSNTSRSERMDIVDKAIHYMQENMNRKILLQDIANEVKLSVSYFANSFYEKTGCSPLRYLTQLRIREACRYLDTTDLKVNQISPLVGIEDALYFSRMFTKTMKMSPLAYRMRKKE